jgi:hypothetical protein
MAGKGEDPALIIAGVAFAHRVKGLSDSTTDFLVVAIVAAANETPKEIH